MVAFKSIFRQHGDTTLGEMAMKYVTELQSRKTSYVSVENSGKES